MSISVSLDIASRALMAQQAAVDTVSHNISNATTAGYSRQRVNMVAVSSANGTGNGVEVLNTERVRDLFLDFQMRSANSNLGQYGAKADSMQRIELALNEPSDNGLRAVMSQFFNSWRDLANDPGSSSTRTAVLQAASTLQVTTSRIYDSFTQLRDEANTRISQDGSEINGLTQQIASLNEQIASLQVSGNQASDLRDSRDSAMDRLSTLVGVTYQNRDDGRVDVSLGGHALVQGGTSYALTGVPNAGNSNYVDLKFADGTVARINDGELKGLIDQRDTEIPKDLSNLNTLVGSVITDVNTAHQAGFGLDGVGNRKFFSGTDASNIGIDPAVDGNPNAIAASTSATGVPGNGDGASAISDLQYAKGLLGGTSSYDDYWSSFISGVGTSSQQAQSLQTSQDSVVQHIDQLRQATSGVNMDEEMVSLMGYQRAYQAAAHVVTIVDDMVDTLINKMT